MVHRKSAAVLLLPAIALIAAVSASCAPQQEPTEDETLQEPEAIMSYTADFRPVEGVETTASGSSTVDIEGGSADYGVTVRELSDAIMAHIHIAEERGAEGPPAVWLYPAADARQPEVREGTTTGALAGGTFTADDFVGPLEGMSMDQLEIAIAEGRAYVNVHTAEYPDGEIRGFLGR
jgi:hypothetical protein